MINFTKSKSTSRDRVNKNPIEYEGNHYDYQNSLMDKKEALADARKYDKDTLINEQLINGKVNYVVFALREKKMAEGGSIAELDLKYKLSDLIRLWDYFNTQTGLSMQFHEFNVGNYTEDIWQSDKLTEADFNKLIEKGFRILNAFNPKSGAEVRIYCYYYPYLNNAMFLIKADSRKQHFFEITIPEIKKNSGGSIGTKADELRKLIDSFGISQNTDFIFTVLANDENSSDDELAAYFKEELKLTDEQVQQIISFRSYFLSGEYLRDSAGNSPITDNRPPITDISAKVLIISSNHPLSTQLQKLTGDSLNNIDFEDLENASNVHVLKHKKSGQVFVVFTANYFAQVDKRVIHDDLNYIKHKYNISKFEWLRKPSYAINDKGLPIIKKEEGGSVEKEILDFKIPEWALSALVNDDYSGLSEEDEAKIKKFREQTAEKYGNASFYPAGEEDEDYSYGFCWRNDIDNLGSNCFKLVLVPSKEYAAGGLIERYNVWQQEREDLYQWSVVIKGERLIGVMTITKESSNYDVEPNVKITDFDYAPSGIGVSKRSTELFEEHKEAIKEFVLAEIGRQYVFAEGQKFSEGGSIVEYEHGYYTKPFIDANKNEVSLHLYHGEKLIGKFSDKHSVKEYIHKHPVYSAGGSIAIDEDAVAQRILTEHGFLAGGESATDNFSDAAETYIAKVGYKGNVAGVALIEGGAYKNPLLITKKILRDIAEHVSIKGVEKIELYTNAGVELHSEEKNQPEWGKWKIIKIGEGYTYSAGGEVGADLKIYKVKDNAYLLYSGNLSKGKPNQWYPSKDEFRTKEVFESIQGKEFPAFDNILHGFKDRIYLHIGKNPHCQSEVFAVSKDYLEDTGKTIKRYNPPTEESSPDAWWSKDGLKVVRLFVQGFTDGFMAFVKNEMAAGGSVTDERKQEIAHEIYNQLGKQTMFMLGAYNFLIDGNGLSFRIRGSKKWKHIKIEYNSMDTYDVTFSTWHHTKLSDNIKREKVEGVYGDMLHQVIETHTGLQTKLPTIYVKHEAGGNVSYGEFGSDWVAWRMANYVYDSGYRGANIFQLTRYIKSEKENITSQEILTKAKEKLIPKGYIIEHPENINMAKVYYSPFAPKESYVSSEPMMRAHGGTLLEYPQAIANKGAQEILDSYLDGNITREEALKQAKHAFEVEAVMDASDYYKLLDLINEYQFAKGGQFGRYEKTGYVFLTKEQHDDLRNKYYLYSQGNKNVEEVFELLKPYFENARMKKYFSFNGYDVYAAGFEYKPKIRAYADERYLDNYYIIFKDGKPVHIIKSMIADSVFYDMHARFGTPRKPEVEYVMAKGGSPITKKVTYLKEKPIYDEENKKNLNVVAVFDNKTDKQIASIIGNDEQNYLVVPTSPLGKQAKYKTLELAKKAIENNLPKEQPAEKPKPQFTDALGREIIIPEGAKFYSADRSLPKSKEKIIKLRQLLTLFKGKEKKEMQEYIKSLELKPITNFSDGGRVHSLRDLTPEEQGGLVTDTLVKGETINVDGKDYLVTQKKGDEIKIKELASGKTGTILTLRTENTAWSNNRKLNIAGMFFRGIEADITRSLLDENNPLGALETESYKRAKKRLAESEPITDNRQPITDYSDGGFLKGKDDEYIALYKEADLIMNAMPLFSQYKGADEKKYRGMMEIMENYGFDEDRSVGIYARPLHQLSKDELKNLISDLKKFIEEYKIDFEKAKQEYLNHKYTIYNSDWDSEMIFDSDAEVVKYVNKEYKKKFREFKDAEAFLKEKKITIYPFHNREYAAGGLIPSMKISDVKEEENPTRYYIRFNRGKRKRVLVLQIDNEDEKDEKIYVTESSDTYEAKSKATVYFEGDLEDFCYENKAVENGQLFPDIALLHFYNNKLRKQFSAGGSVDIEKAKLKYAKADIKWLEEIGNLAITDTKHGVLWGNYENGIFSFSKRDGEELFKGNKAEAIEFVKNAYTVDKSKAAGGSVQKSILNSETDLLGKSKSPSLLTLQQYLDERGYIDEADKKTAIQAHKTWVNSNLDKYVRFVSEGRMTASDAAIIIDSAGLDVPDEIQTLVAAEVRQNQINNPEHHLPLYKGHWYVLARAKKPPVIAQLTGAYRFDYTFTAANGTAFVVDMDEFDRQLQKGVAHDFVDLMKQQKQLGFSNLYSFIEINSKFISEEVMNKIINETIMVKRSDYDNFYDFVNGIFAIL